MNRKAHWDTVYTAKSATEVSWYQAYPGLSLQLINTVPITADSHIIDIGGGASTLVDHLLDAGFHHLTVLDISTRALETAQARLGPDARRVTWLDADITQADLASSAYDLWHDRAVFHFLTNDADRAAYVRALRQALRSGGQAIIATFALDGPTRCSGLEVVRWD